MKNRPITITTTVLAVVISTSTVEAGFGKLLREGAEYLGKQARKVMTEGAESGARKAGSIVDDLSAKTTGKAVTTGSKEAGERMVAQSGRALVLTGRNAADDILLHLGPAGVESMGKLTPLGARRLADVSAELAKNPRKAEWLQLIGQSGDAVATFLWERKLSVGVATAATAVVLAPEEFLQASEGVMTSAVSAAGRHVVEPLINQTAQHVAGPVAHEVTRHAAAQFPWTLAWCLIFGSVAGGFVFWRIRSRRK
jgi:hypothetical protein